MRKRLRSKDGRANKFNTKNNQLEKRDNLLFKVKDI
jgi:hypothetical protein